MFLIQHTLTCDCTVESEICIGRVFHDLDLLLTQSVFRRLDRGLGGSDVVALRKAEDQALGGNAEDDGNAKRSAGRLTVTAQGVDGGNEGVLRLTAGGARFVEIGLGAAHFGTVAQGKINGGLQ